MKIAQIILIIILLGISYKGLGQTFNSSIANFSIQTPNSPNERLDTLRNELGNLPRYIMLDATTSHGKNLLYVVTVWNLENVPEKQMNLGLLEQVYINEKINQSNSFKNSKQIKFNTLEGKEFVFKVNNASAHLYSRVFLHSKKLYMIETIAIGSNKGKKTQEYLESFKLL